MVLDLLCKMSIILSSRNHTPRKRVHYSYNTWLLVIESHNSCSCSRWRIAYHTRLQRLGLCAICVRVPCHRSKVSYAPLLLRDVGLRTVDFEARHFFCIALIRLLNNILREIRLYRAREDKRNTANIRNQIITKLPRMMVSTTSTSTGITTTTSNAITTSTIITNTTK